MRRRSLVALLSGCFLAAALATSGAAQAREGDAIVVFAAASLRNVLDDLIADWHQSGGAAVVVSYAGTSALARQIEQGAPADILISADEKWMQYLVDKHLIASRPAGATGVFARNRIVLVAPAASAAVRSNAAGTRPPVVNADFPLAEMLGDGGRFAMADPAHVPAGRYGRAALESVGLYELARPLLTRSANVRQALALVARGECPVGLVYASDAQAEPAVRIIGRFAPAGLAPVIYPAALVKRNEPPDADAAALLTWLLDHARGEQLLRHGLLMPSAG